MALSGDTAPDMTSALAELADAPEVFAHHGPCRAPDRPLVTSGQWVRSGGAVLERGCAAAPGVGDRVAVAGRPYPVVGIAVTSA